MSIEFKNVYFSYNKGMEYSNKDISFKLDEPFFAALIGQTGSGKSTLIQQINGLLLPSEGLIITDDFTLIGGSKKKIKDVKGLRKYASIVFQFPEYQLFEETVLKDVAFGPKNFGASKVEALERAKVALKKVNIGEEYYDKSPFELSGGEKRKVAIAGILALNPKVLILDEPCAGLDPKSKDEMMELFNELYKNGTSIIMVSHDMDMVLKYCTTCLVMKNATLLGQYKPYELFFNNDLMKEALIYPPRIIKYVNTVLKKGYKIDITKIKDINTFISSLKEVERC